MGKFWSILFLMVPVFGIGLFFWAPTTKYWLPRDISQHGYQIDHLFNFILVLTGVVFAATEAALFWFLWRYDAASASNRGPVKYTHGSHNLEVVWTILPAATLLFIAIYQMNAWADVKMRVPKDMPPTLEVTARQFEWRLRYPGPYTPDSIGAMFDEELERIERELPVDAPGEERERFRLARDVSEQMILLGAFDPK